MSRWDKVRLGHEDCEFIWDWLTKSSLKKTDIDTFPPVFKKWEIEVNLPRKTVNSVGHDKNLSANDRLDNIRLNIKARVLSEEKNVVRFNIRITYNGMEIDRLSATVMFCVMHTMEEVEEMGKFIDNSIDGKTEFPMPESTKESFHSLSLKEVMDIGKLLKIDEERTVKTIEKTMLPALFIADCGTSRPRNEQVDALIDLSTEMYINVSIFLAYFKPEVDKYTTREIAAVSAPKKKQYKKSQKKKQGEVCSIINISSYIQDVKTGREKLPRRKCPYAYKVRGHFRHYKSGQKVWIAEYTKNTEEKRKARVIKLSGVKKHQKDKKNITNS